MRSRRGSPGAPWRSRCHSAFRTPHSEFAMQAIAWSPSGAVRILDQRALPGARIERDLETAEAVAEAIRTLQVRGAPLIGIAAALALNPAFDVTPAHYVRG